MATFLGVQIWLVVLIFVYCVARELTRVIGPNQVRRILFGAPFDRRVRVDC